MLFVKLKIASPFQKRKNYILLYCLDVLFHPGSLPVFSDSCTQRLTRLSYPSGLSQYIVCIEIHVIFPDMPLDYFLMFFALCTLGKIRTILAIVLIAFIFPIPLLICCPICKNLVCRVDIAVIVFIIDIFIFLKKSFFGHGTFIRKQRLYPFFQ